MPQAKRMEQRHRVEMHVDASGNLEVGAAGKRAAASKFALHVSRNDHVEFHCLHGDFGIHFPRHSPFEEKEYLATAGQPIVATVRADAAAGRYKHNVSVALKGGRKLWDPDIVVDD